MLHHIHNKHPCLLNLEQYSIVWKWKYLITVIPFFFYSQTRKRHNHILQWSNTKETYVNKITGELGALFDSKIKAPNTLIELLQTDYRRIKDNIIHLEGLL